ncbi:stress response protein NST1-like [Rosa sericea]
MSPASSKSKSKDKKLGKEAPAPALKPSSGAANAGSGIPASAYNPLLGTFHTLELSPTSSASAVHSNSRFRNIDETDDHSGGSVAAGAEYDSVSNNGSWSGESEEHKDKTSNPPVKPETVPGADNDKREKIRQKNERKHQRQKERRAQELHERCSGYLMSRKLEALAQQLVAMGFNHDEATEALIQNEGRVEESVSWLLEGASDSGKPRDQNVGGSNLKIDISEELAQIADLEVSFKCLKQEVERAIVACEGDLHKAAESLRVAKQDPPSISPKPEETGDPPTASNGKVPVTVNQNLRPQVKSNPPTIQQRRDDKDFNYTKQGATVGGPVDSANKPLQPLKRGQPKLEWAKGQPTPVPADRRWSSAGSNPSVSYSLASPLQASSPPVKTEARYVAVGGELKNLQPGTVREPVIMMQRPQSVNTKQVPATSMSSSPPGTATNWYPSTSVELMRSSGFLPQIPSSTSLSTSNLGSNQMYHQFQYQQQQQQQHQQQHQQQQQQHQHFIPGGPGDSPGTIRGNNLWNRAGASQTLAAASSLGLFSGLGSAGSSGASSPVDWSAGGGSFRHLDYTNIDWSLDRGVTPSTRPNGLWTGMPSAMKSNTNFYDSKTTGLGAQSAMRPASSNMNGVTLVGLQDGGANADASAAGSGEWTSPFEGVDLFRIPRQFVSSSP